MSEYEDRCYRMPNTNSFDSFEEAKSDFKSKAMTNQKQIIDRIKSYIEKINSNKMFQEKSVFSRNIIISSLNRILREISSRLVIDLSKQDGYWSYAIYVFEDRVQIRYQKLGYSSAYNEWMIEAYDTFCECEAVLYSVNEYAEAYDVAVTTVREWIRRGKISNAKKKGLEWFIPALTEPLDTADCSIVCERISYDDDLSDMPVIDDNAKTIEILKSEKKGIYNIVFVDSQSCIYDDLKVSKNEMMKIRRRLLESPDFKNENIGIVFADNY